MILPVASEFLAPARSIDGFLLGCLVDGSTGMLLASLRDEGAPDPPTAAAGAADVANVLALLGGRLASGELLEDVTITFSDNFFMIRPIRGDTGSRLLLLVVLDRRRTNLALAHRSLRDMCAGYSA